MYVLGTAGHVDHGKSALILALTGMDPDRLEEEKARGMTIDLGFAWLTLPSGREVSIVDVPGHERFISNMLAGVGGIDVALLVIAADEGVMPQTREHLVILDLVGVSSGIVAITKKDLVEEEWLELVVMDAKSLIKGTSLAQAPIIAVSAVTRAGLDELTAAIDHILDSTPPKKDLGRPRLPVDRIFTISGFGTVVTGTLIDGQFSLGQEVEVLPPAIKARVRGLQSHKKKIEKALPGNRVAMNLTGVPIEQLERGHVITTPGWLLPTRALDVKLRLLPSLSRPLLHNTEVAFFTGASEVMGTVRLLEKNEILPGESAWAQLVLKRPVTVVKGDPFVVRSPNETLGGGVIVETHARRHRRFHEDTLQKLTSLEKGSTHEVLLATIQKNEPTDLESLLSQINITPTEMEAVAQELISQKKVFPLTGKGPKTVVITAAGLHKKELLAIEATRSYHRQFPLRRGIPREELRSRLKLAPAVFEGSLKLLIPEKLADEGPAVRLPSFRITPSKDQQKAVDDFLLSLKKNPFSTPSELIPEAELLNYLIDRGDIVKVSGDVVFGKAAYDEAVQRIVGQIKAQGKITLAEARNMFQTSRKYAQALLEYLDEQRITRRVGDERVLRN